MEKKYVFHFPRKFVDKPIMSNLVRKYELDFNILKAYITPEEEGTLVLALQGDEDKVELAISEVKELGIVVQSIASDIKMVRELCTDCSVCIPLCPVKALTLNRKDFSVEFDPEKCIACGLCIKACPTKAMVLTI
ncbi:MAG TPA: 4Fe-4S binding protein [bacterium]|nr:4Fe-4S binding protein [bacterium]